MSGSSIEPGEMIVMKKLVFLVLGFALIGSYAPAQDANSNADLQELFGLFTRAVKVEEYTLSFVLLNDKVVDALFQPPGKYAIRARANQATTFYVQGITEQDVTIDTKFSAEQDGQAIPGNVINIKNFEGGKIARGERFSGLFQLDRKLDLTHAFKIVTARGTVEFKLSEEALAVIRGLTTTSPGKQKQ
jgi:hypothetical protein